MTAIDTGTPRLLARREGAVAWITFNNPEKRNAVSLDMWDALARVLPQLEADPQTLVIVLTGAGDKAFVSGADISQFETERAGATANESYSKRSGAGVRILQAMNKPTIAMIRGFCLGGGMSLALSCDLRICSDNSQFGVPAARLGVGYRFDSVRALAALVGPARAKEMLFTARRYSASDALTIGLVNHVEPDAALEQAVHKLAGEIAQNAPLAVASAKISVREALKDKTARDMPAVEQAVAQCFASSDFVEGRTAFLEKRKPVFTGK